MRQPIRDLIEDIEGRRTSFYEALEGQDDLGVAIRTHIFIERELRHFIRVKAPVPEYIDFDEMDYNATLTLAMILGLSKELRSPLKALGRLRNKFSHRPNMMLNRSDTADLYAKLGPAAQKDLTLALRQIAPTYPDRATDPQRMSPKKLFAATCFHLHLQILYWAVTAAASEQHGEKI